MSRPNILWYCTDQQRFDTVGALGNPHVQTATLDGLVRDGVACTRTYCQSPVCTPSRSSFLTGMYPSRLHNTRNGNATFPGFPPLVTKLVADSGYTCGLVGKLHLQSAGHRTEPRIDDGYSFWRFSHAPRDDWEQGHDYAEWVRQAGGDLDELRGAPERVPATLHQTTWASECAIEFITQRHTQPWLLCVNTYDPHPPFVPPQSYAERFDVATMPGPHFRPSDLEHQRRLANIDFQGRPAEPAEHDAFRKQALYYAMIAQVDDQLARILDTLDSTGQAADTVIIFMSDHGEALGDHGLFEKGCRFYEGLVRVPLIFRWPGHFVDSLQCDGLVELLDVTATVLDVAGLPAPDYLQGSSLVPILSGIAPADHHRDFVRSEYFDALDSHFTGGSGTFATMYLDGRHKLTVYHGHGLGELYDLQEDPWEFHDLWNEPSAQPLKHRLIHDSFDAHVLLTTDVGAPRIAPM